MTTRRDVDDRQATMRQPDLRARRIPFAGVVGTAVTQRVSARRQELGSEPALEAGYSAHGAKCVC